jgi:thiol-disulfide isomerase/thioredoxin
MSRLVAIVAFATLSACAPGSGASGGGSGASHAVSDHPLIGAPAPDFELSSFDGKGKVALATSSGKVTIVDFWATWCEPCRASFPAYQKMRDDFDGKLEVLGISVDEDSSGIADFKASTGVKFPLAWDEVEGCNPADFTLASMPARFSELGDRHAEIDRQPGSIEGLLELFERQGLGDAPWPPHYRRQASEPPRVQPSKRKSSKPLIEIGRARRKEDALAGVERWKARHPQAAAHLQPADVLIDSMRGRSSTWTRTRINLETGEVTARAPRK